MLPSSLMIHFNHSPPLLQIVLVTGWIWMSSWSPQQTLQHPRVRVYPPWWAGLKRPIWPHWEPNANPPLNKCLRLRHRTGLSGLPEHLPLSSRIPLSRDMVQPAHNHVQTYPCRLESAINRLTNKLTMSLGFVPFLAPTAPPMSSLYFIVAFNLCVWQIAHHKNWIVLPSSFLCVDICILNMFQAKRTSTPPEVYTFSFVTVIFVRVFPSALLPSTPLPSPPSSSLLPFHLLSLHRVCVACTQHAQSLFMLLYPEVDVSMHHLDRLSLPCLCSAGLHQTCHQSMGQLRRPDLKDCLRTKEEEDEEEEGDEVVCGWPSSYVTQLTRSCLSETGREENTFDAKWMHSNIN